jgi:hypothetical protein
MARLISVVAILALALGLSTASTGANEKGKRQAFHRANRARRLSSSNEAEVPNGQGKLDETIVT